MVRIADGDEDAMAFLRERYVDVLSGLIAAIVKRREDADEVLGQVFRQVREKAGDFNQAKDTVYGWLLAMARDLAVQKAFPPGSERATGPDSGPEAAARHAVDMQRIRTALAEVPEVPRRMIEETYLGGYSQSQVAARMGIPLGRVKIGMRYGFRSLKSKLRETA